MPMSYCTMQHGKTRGHKGVSCRKRPLVDLEYGERAGALWQFLAGQKAVEANGAQLQLDSMAE